MNNNKQLLEKLDSQISSVQTEIDKVINSGTKKTKANIKKLYDSYVNTIQDMQSFILNTDTIGGKQVDDLHYNILVWDTRFNMFWNNPNVLNNTEVLKNKLTELNSTSKDEFHQKIIEQSNKTITYEMFEKFYLDGYIQDNFTLTFYIWNKEAYINNFTEKYKLRNDGSCGMVREILNNFWKDITYGQHYVDSQIQYSDIEKNEDYEYGYSVYSISTDKLSSREYSNSKGIMDYKHINNKLMKYGHLVSVCDVFLTEILDDMNNINCTQFYDTSDLTNELNELKRHRGAVWRLKLYHEIDSFDIDLLNYVRIEGDGTYSYGDMRVLKRFYTTNNICVENVDRVMVLKRLESKVKLRIFITKEFYKKDGKLVKYTSDKSNRVFVPMYIEKSVDIRLYIDFIAKYMRAKNTHGLLDQSEDNLKKVQFYRPSLQTSQNSNVDNWKWEFTKDVINTYDTSELTLIEW